ncbi:AMP-binding protein [Pyxidicoccus fallax]|uniref:Phenylacetate--CoA ligase n=1 Tax=Pyxidicoccus fallax TaxID=394095 RepID=A0A848LBR3_9BACT|nr:AMP-binding protein [Pyxidicoccus fallax]NMO15934.1 phenylacetate--CoA ligase [Pyxidicoccus fallax]NPC79330.1 AMP-binding protein [Pyxidicoccus fallax]
MRFSFEKRLRALQSPPVISRYFSGEGHADTMPPARLARYQLEALKAIVQRAYDQSPFYREKMTGAGVSPGDLERLEDLSKLPFLTKDELRGRPWLLLTCDKKDVVLIQVSTGTTGGEEIYMTYTWNDYLLHDLSPRYGHLFPVGPGDVCLNALPYEMSTAGLSFHKTFMDGYQSTVIPAGKGGAYSTPAKTLKMIRDLRPNVVVTSPSWSMTLAEEAASGSFDLKSLGIKKMWLTGEGCSPAFRRRVENIWGTTANYFYGSLECGALGIECDAHNGYHLTQAHVLMEIVDPKTGVSLPPGEIGEIVVTALLRYDSPVIRFRTGDLGSLDTAACACGSTLTRFHMKGRAFDQLHFRGRPLSPFFLEEFLMRMPEVGNWFQFVMPASDSARIKIRCELADGVPPSAELAATLASRMEASTGLPFDIELVDHLPRPNGKAVRVVRE